MDDEMLTISEVCRYLGITRSTWYRWQSAGWGPSPVILGPPTTARKRTVRVRKTELAAYLGGSNE
jgi:predicted DNA-binding transcriptional regulator AlpA